MNDTAPQQLNTLGWLTLVASYLDKVKEGVGADGKVCNVHANIDKRCLALCICPICPDSGKCMDSYCCKLSIDCLDISETNVQAQADATLTAFSKKVELGKAMQGLTKVTCSGPGCPSGGNIGQPQGVAKQPEVETADPA